MGHGLGLQVVAEGVEKLSQVQALKMWGCDVAQGRLFGDPVGIHELLAQMRAQQGGRPAFAAMISSTPSDDALLA
jgi:EAL domain-containing protein (putative c-di-GMP-specific phosphodiesterase class I)